MGVFEGIRMSCRHGDSGLVRNYYFLLLLSFFHTHKYQLHSLSYQSSSLDQLDTYHFPSFAPSELVLFSIMEDGVNGKSGIASIVPKSDFSLRGITKGIGIGMGYV